MKFKICTRCKKELQATKKYFYERKMSKDGLQSKCKKCSSKYAKKYYKKNRNMLLKRQNDYREINKDRVLEYQKEWRRSERGKKYLKEYNRKNWRKYYEKDKEGARKRHRHYCKTEKGRAACRKWGKKQHKNNRLSCNVSRSMRKSLKQNKTYFHWETFVPYTLEELALHLQKTIGLTDKIYLSEFWQYFYGSLYHVDHIIPRSFFDSEKLQDPNSKEFQECWALKNLQLLFDEKNRKKSNNIQYCLTSELRY